MTTLLVAVLLGAAVAVEALCALGLLRFRTTYNRLHLLGPATLLGGPLVALALLAQEGAGQSFAKAALVGLLMIFWGPVLTHATARAAWISQRKGDARLAASPVERRE